MLDLYHAEPVANSMKSLLCLKEKGLEFTSHYVELLRFEQHSDEFVRLNPNGQVPVLVHDGAVITESTVINEYLDDAALSMWGWHLMVRRVARSLSKNELEESKRKLRVSIGRMEKILAKSAWLSGSSYSLADVNSYSMVAAVPRNATPLACAWLDAMNARPAVKAALSMPNKVPEVLRTFGG